MKRDTWEYVQEFIDKFGHFPKDMDELIVCVDYVINRNNANGSTPKFKVGDTVRMKSKKSEICTIEAIDEDCYYCDFTNFDIIDQDDWEIVA